MDAVKSSKRERKRERIDAGIKITLRCAKCNAKREVFDFQWEWGQGKSCLEENCNGTMVKRA